MWLQILFFLFNLVFLCFFILDLTCINRIQRIQITFTFLTILWPNIIIFQSKMVVFFLLFLNLSCWWSSPIDFTMQSWVEDFSGWYLHYNWSRLLETLFHYLFLLFNIPLIASNKHVLAKTSWPTGALLYHSLK